MSLWLGLDIGTSSVKAVVCDTDGMVLASARGVYPTHRSEATIAEQDPEDYLRAVDRAMSELDVDRGAVVGIGLSGHTPTAVPVDARGHPTRPAMSWQDTRATAESEELAAEFGDATPLFGTPLAWSATALPAKMLWLSRHQPEVVSQTRWILQPKDYLGLFLTGSPLSDRWSSKGLCDVRDGRPSTAFLRHVGWDESVCPPTDDAWASRGALLPGPAARLGLRAGIPVSVGWSDALAAMLRVGAFATASSFVLTGTSDIVGTSYVGDGPLVEGLLTIPRQCAPLSVCYGPTQSSGDALEWLARVLGRSVEETLDLPARAPDQPAIFVPYLRGERAPLWRSDVRAGFANLSGDHGPGDLVDAVLNGVSLTARQILERCEPRDGALRDLNIAGFSTTAERWTGARLRTLGRPLVLHRQAHASAVGAAALGAAAGGLELGRVVTRFAEPTDRVLPSERDFATAECLWTEFCALSAFALQTAGARH
ncbi:MAG: FGGY family carbohydrate kinase [Nocardioides sp.]